MIARGLKKYSDIEVKRVSFKLASLSLVDWYGFWRVYVQYYVLRDVQMQFESIITIPTIFEFFFNVG